MILKEAYRYQNFLNKLIERAKIYLLDKNYITTTTEFHNKSKAYSCAKDEIRIVKSGNNLDVEPNILIDFVIKAFREKEKLTHAISNAKKKTAIDIDGSISINKTKNEIISYFQYMGSLKPSEVDSTAKDYKFNDAGEQVAYYYPVVSETSINFDRKDVKGIIRKLQKERDEVSSQLDKIEIETDVDYVAPWDVNSSLEDILEIRMP